MGWKWVAIPWLPVSLIGTAVAFYVGFKNNQSYDRSWEARTAWGGIVNLSRSFAAAAAYLTAGRAEDPAHEEALQSERRTLVYRHLAWLYSLMESLN
jgi:putative membrane protein